MAKAKAKDKAKDKVKDKDKSKDSELGKEILSYCGKCKMPVAHVILTVNKKGVADKCECQTCSAKHKYRDPEKPVKPRATKRTSKKTISAEALWNEAIAGAKGSAKTYRMSADFSEGDLMDHSTFGKGVVEGLVGSGKIKVIFENGEKILVHNRD